MISVANSILVITLYRYWFLPTRNDNLTAYNAQSRYQYGWLVFYEGAKYIWLPPAIFWIGSQLYDTIAWALGLTIWYTFFVNYFAPLILVVGCGAMFLGAIEWDDTQAYDEVMSQYETLAVASVFLLFQGFSYYTFR